MAEAPTRALVWIPAIALARVPIRLRAEVLERTGGKQHNAPIGSGDPVRLQKALAEAGLGSRREIEGWISAGRVRVNGQLAKLGDRVSPADRVRVDGKDIKRRSPRRGRPIVLAYHKPEGEVVTRRDPEARPTIFQRLPGIRDGRWISVGRLDMNTAGLLLVTTMRLANG